MSNADQGLSLELGRDRALNVAVRLKVDVRGRLAEVNHKVSRE